MTLQLAELWLCDTILPPAKPLQRAWLLAGDRALDCGRALSLLGAILRLCQEAWEVSSDWCQSAEGRTYKAKGLSATKSNRRSFFNSVFFGYRLPCLWAVAVSLGFVSTGPCIVCFWEFSARLLKSSIALKTDLVKSHLPMVPQPWQAGAGLGYSHSWDSSCHVFFYHIATTSSPLSHAIAEQSSLSPTFRKHAHLLHEVQCPQQAAETCGSY